VCKCNNFRIKN